MPQPQYIISKSVHNPATPGTPNQNESARPALPQNPLSETHLRALHPPTPPR